MLILFQTTDTSNSQTIVSMVVGRIAGVRKQTDIEGNTRVVTQFLGIPYGEDTSGHNRFRRPVPKAPFNKTYEAYIILPSCMQLIVPGFDAIDMTEDC